MDISDIEESLHIKDYIAVLRRRRDIIITFFVTTVVVVTIGSFIMKKIYRATATLLIDTESPNVLTTTGSVELGSQNYYSYKEYFQSQMQIIISRPIASEVFEGLNLGSPKEYAKSKDPIAGFLKSVNAEPVRDTRLLKLNVDNRDPELAAKIANRMAEIYVKRNLAYISKNELLNLLKNEYLKLKSKLSEYSKVYKEGHPEIIKLRQEIAELIKKMEQEKNVSVYGISGEDTLSGLKANNINILEPAEVPKTPIKPKKILNIALSVIFGLFGGMGLAFFLEYLDDTVRSIDDVEKLLRWPFLGNIPKIDSDGTMSEFEKDVFVKTNPKDPIAEAYRTIRTAVALSNTEEHPVKSIAITSLGPQEGKTTTICNLSIVIAQNQKKVLLVDADMRKPRLNTIFNKENKSGLSTFLSSKELNLDEMIQKTDVDNLYLVNGGPHPPNPSELLSSHKYKEFITLAKERFDYVLLDTPPIAVITDALLVSQAVDGLIVVVESGKTPKRALPRIYKLLEDAKVRVIGTIINKISISSDNYYYYSYYYGKLDNKKIPNRESFILMALKFGHQLLQGAYQVMT